MDAPIALPTPAYKLREDKGWWNAVAFDQHPARKGKDDFAGRDPGGIFKDHQSEYPEPAKFVEDHL